MRMVIDKFRLPLVLDSMKRNQDSSMTDVTLTLVSHDMQMQGLSINRMEDVLENLHGCEIYVLCGMWVLMVSVVSESYWTRTLTSCEAYR